MHEGIISRIFLLRYLNCNFLVMHEKIKKVLALQFFFQSL